MNVPLILVTNDDGITAPGIRHLIRAMNGLGTVVVVAPDSPQSGMGHAITLQESLRLRPMQVDAGPQTEYSCSGTPVDCVKLALHEVLKDQKPNLIVSGVNHGSNASVNVIYSGTMSAAVEGASDSAAASAAARASGGRAVSARGARGIMLMVRGRSRRGRTWATR